VCGLYSNQESERERKVTEVWESLWMKLIDRATKNKTQNIFFLSIKNYIVKLKRNHPQSNFLSARRASISQKCQIAQTRIKINMLEEFQTFPSYRFRHQTIPDLNISYCWKRCRNKHTHIASTPELDNLIFVWCRKWRNEIICN
jgi:hypothetical protein